MRRVSKVGVDIANVDHGGGHVTADLDTLLIALYVLADGILPRRPRARRNPRITDAELVCLARPRPFLAEPMPRRYPPRMVGDPDIWRAANLPGEAAAR